MLTETKDEIFTKIEGKIPVYLDDEQCRILLVVLRNQELHKKFCQYLSVFREMFEIRGGSAEVHFDLKGIMRQFRPKPTKIPKDEFMSYPQF